MEKQGYKVYRTVQQLLNGAIFSFCFVIDKFKVTLEFIECLPLIFVEHIRMSTCRYHY